MTQPRGRGRPRHPGARDAIVEATLALLAERGFGGTTMDDVAARAGVGKNTIYRRWPSKDDLVVDALGELTAVVDPHEGEAVYDFLVERVHDLRRVFGDPQLGRILPGLIGELDRNPAFAAAYAERVVRPRRHAIVEVLKHGVESGELHENTNPELIADLLVGPLLYRMLLPFGLRRPGKGYADELLETIWTGIAP